MSDRIPQPHQGGRCETGSERVSATPSASGAGGVVASSHRAASRRAGASPTTALPRPRDLRETQLWMLAAVTGAESDLDAAEGAFTDGPRMAARERVEIYRSGYRARLIECLVDDYPVLAQLLERPRFEQLCLGYIERHPSSAPNLNGFGRHLPAFCLEADVDDVFDDVRAFASELATLEWTLVEVLHAETSEPASLASLQGVPAEAWGGVTFTPSEAVRVLRFAYPVSAFFQAVWQGGGVPPAPAPEATSMVIYRQGLGLWRMDLTPAMTRVLDALLAGSPLGDALSAIAIDEDDAGALAEAERSVMIWFQAWMAGGFFSGVSANLPTP
jgi:hypothetical protein